MSLWSWSSGRDERWRRRHDHQISQLEALTALRPGQRATPAVASLYRDVLLEAIHRDPVRARAAFETYDARLTASERARAFGQSQEPRLRRALRRPDTDALSVVTEVAWRAGLTALRDRAVSELLPRLGRTGDAHRLLDLLIRLRRADALSPALLAAAVDAYLESAEFTTEPQPWIEFFAAVPSDALPRTFDVHMLLSRYAEAADLADSAERRRVALAYCRQSEQPPDLEAGLRVAQTLGDDAAASECHAKLGGIAFAGGRIEHALPHLEAAGAWGQVAECHARLGHWAEAFQLCPDDDHDRLDRNLSSPMRQLISRF